MLYSPAHAVEDVDEDLLDRIKQFAGDVPRQRFIGRILDRALSYDDEVPRRSFAGPAEVTTHTPEPSVESVRDKGRADTGLWGGVGGRPPIQKRSKR